jgi:hypothetical protein
VPLPYRSFPAAAVRVLAGCAAACASLAAFGVPLDQPVIGVRSKPVLTAQGLQFRDANGSGGLDPYEDWRQPVEARVRDLVARMTLEEKAGLMLIETLNAGCGGAVTPAATALIGTQKMTRFILRTVVKAAADPCDGSMTPGRGGHAVTPCRPWPNRSASASRSSSRTTRATTTTPIRASASPAAPAPSPSSPRRRASRRPRSGLQTCRR